MGICKSDVAKKHPEKKRILIIPQESIEELEEIKLSSIDIGDILQNAKQEGGMTNPLVVCISTKQNQMELNDEKHSEISIIDGGTHQQIRQKVQQTALDKLYDSDSKYDGFVIILLCIILTNQDKLSPKYFFDRAGQERHVDKFRQDIVERVSKKPIILNYSKAVKLHGDGNTIRPSSHMEQSNPNGKTVLWNKYVKPKAQDKIINNQPQKPTPSNTQ